jgi:hypothetical protein
MNREIEDIFKNKFENFESQPSADLFNRIQAKQKSKRKAAFLRYAAIFGLVITGGLLFLGLPSKLGQSEEGKLSESRDIIQQSAPVEKTDIEPTNQEIQNETSEPIVDSKNEKTTQSPLKSRENHTTPLNKSLDLDNKIVNKQLADRFNEILAQNKNKDPNKATVFAKDKMYDVGQRPKEEIKNSKVETPVSAENKDEETRTNERENLLLEQAVANKIQAPETEEKPEDEDLPNNAHRSRNWTLQLAAGPGYADRILTGPPNSVMARNNSEKPRISYNADILAIYRLNSKWNVASGLSYVQYNEAFDFSKTTTSITPQIKYDTITIYQNPLPPRQVILIDTTYISNTETTRYQDHNTYKTIQVPISLERIFTINEKLNVYAQTAINATVWKQSTGLVLDGEDQSIVELSSIANSKLGLDAVSLGIGVGYKLDERTQLIFYPKANYMFNSRFGDSYAIKQSEIGLFTNFGLRYKF